MRHPAAVLLATLLVLAPLSAPATGAAEVTLTVTVVDQDGNNIAGATLEASWDGGSTTETTASNGRAFVDVPEGADVTIRVSHPEYVRNRPYIVSNAEEEDVEVPVWRTGALRLVVRNASARLAGADVSFTKNRYTQHAVTNESGIFATGAIEQGSYTVRAVHPGYLRKTVEVDVDGNVTETITLRSGSVQIGFRVVDDHFEPPRPLENAEVTVLRDGNRIASAETLSDGEQTVSVPVNTRLTLRVTKDGYVTTERGVVVGERPEQYNFTIRRTPAINVEVLSDRVVVGEQTIIEAIDEYGEPVSGATVLVDGESVGETDAEGEFRLTVKSAGDHEVRVRRGDLESDPVTVSAVSGTTATTTTETTTATTTTTTTRPTTTTATTTTTPTTTAPTTATTETTTTGSEGVPGFTVGGALAALAAAVLLVRRQ